MSTRNPITTVGRSSESLFTNVESGKGRFLFKEKPEIKNICGLFGTASQPNIKRNPKIEKSDFKEVFIKYYGVNLQASSGGQGGLFTNIKDGSISTSTKGHYMSPKTKNERISLRSIDYNEDGQPVNELFQQLIRDIDQNNDNTTNFTGDFRNTIKILGGEGVDMTKEDVFGILFVHDGGSEGKTVTGNGIIYHIYRHVNVFKKSVLKKVESYFEVTGNTLKIASDTVTLQVVEGLAKLIGSDRLNITKGPISEEEERLLEELREGERERERNKLNAEEGTVTSKENQESAAAKKVMGKAETVLQKILQVIPASSGGGGRVVRDAINVVQSVKENVKDYGIEEVILIPFNEEFSKMNEKRFIDEVLVKKLNAKHVIRG